MVCLCASLIALSACKTAGGNAGGGDPSESTIKMYLYGQIKAASFVAVHDNVSTGQAWETTSTAGGSNLVQTWQITKMTGRGEFIIENDTGMGYVLAYRVNTWADAGQPNVLEAWIGTRGRDPESIQVMEWKSGEAAPMGSEARVETQSFADVTIAGKTFSGDVMTASSSSGTTRTWVASNGWFDRVIRMDVNGRTILEVSKVHFDEKAPALLKWDNPRAK